VVADLGRCKTSEAATEFARIARTDPSAFLRRQAIGAMGSTATRGSLLALTSLLTFRFPSQLRAELGWAIPPRDFATIFPSFIAETLEQATGKSFGTDQRAWREWVEANVSP
jgi:hypothetical protein